MNITSAAGTVLAALVAILAAIIGYNAGTRRAVRRMIEQAPTAPLFQPAAPAPWWARPHLKSLCVNAKCRVHFPGQQCPYMVGDEWCDRAAGHSGDCWDGRTARNAYGADR